MKKFLVNLSISSGIIFIIDLFIILLFSGLSQANIINSNVNDNVLLAVGLVSFLCFGFLFGFKQKEKGLLYGLLIGALYLAIAFSIYAITKKINIETSLFVVSKSILITVGSIIGVNIKRK